jgi:mannose-6-phosphate isomerase-like protein (cupin superfamily)
MPLPQALADSRHPDPADKLWDNTRAFTASMGIGMKVRRVVTGHDRDGKAVFASDEQVDPLALASRPDRQYHRLWGADQAPTFPDDGSPTAQHNYFPPVGGYRFGLFTVLPGSVSVPGLDREAARAEMEEKLPGFLAHLEPDNPGMHTTDTIDFEVVLSGEVILELDDGVEKVLRPGDTVVQNGTRHRWGNRGTEPAVVALFVVGAHRTSE